MRNQKKEFAQYHQEDTNDLIKIRNAHFNGYASVYNILDNNQDVILPRAIKRRHEVKLLWQHELSCPIGKILSMEEDENGLYVEAELLLTLKLAREVWHLISSNVINGLSIGYQVLDCIIDEKANIRYITELLLWEISVVTIPANNLSVIYTTSLVPNTVKHTSLT